MKHIDYQHIPLIEVEEVKYYPDQWKKKLQEAVYHEGVQTSFDSRVKIVDKIDVWDIK